MPADALESEAVDPLSGLNGLSLFPRTIRASAGISVPVDYKDLDSIHNAMKSLELRSPQMPMNEAKIIMDGGEQLLKSNLGSFAKSVGFADDIAAKAQDRPQERRPGLGLARKRAPFSLKTTVSQPSVSLEPTMNIDHLQDPDDFFDAYERMENAKKEIQKQLGGSMVNLDHYKPSNTTRRRRPGILGKSYSYKHRFSAAPCENDDMMMSPREAVDQDIPCAPQDESQEKMVHPSQNDDADLEDVEAVSMKKIDNEVNDILEDLLSFDNEDLEGDGALNLLQERLNIKPLDLENLRMSELPNVGRTSTFNLAESLQTPASNQLVTDSLMKSLNRKSHAKHPLVISPGNTVSSPTPPRSPFASISILKKKILQPSSPLRDPFSTLNIDLSAYQNASPLQPELHEQVHAPKDLDISCGLESRVEVDDTETTTSNMDAQKVMHSGDSLLQQFVYMNASMQSTDADSRLSESDDKNETTMNVNQSQNSQEHLNIKPLDLENLFMSELPDVGRTSISNVAESLQKSAKNPLVIDSALKSLNRKSHTKHQLVVTPVNTVSSLTPPRSPFASTSILKKKILQPSPLKDPFSTLNIDLLARQNASPLQPEPHEQVHAPKDFDISRGLESRVEVDDTEPTTSNMDGQKVMHSGDSLLQQFADVNASMQSTDADSRLNEESDDQNEKAMNVNENESNPSALEEEIRNDVLSRQQTGLEQHPEAPQPKPQRGKSVAGHKRIRQAHPMRKSLAESGTSFEAGVRRSKRIKMRPLEYWKGERFLYGRVNDSLKLIGVKYFSPGKDTDNLKVKPYVSSAECEELLEVAARH